jgi:aspartate racemase
LLKNLLEKELCMKTVGIIGGMGPETTAEFYLELVFGCYELNTIERPPILIWNVPQKCQMEEDALAHAKGVERYIPYLQEAAKILEKGGADFIVMPCNTLHLFIDDIRKSVKIPVLSILEETAKFLKEKRVLQVGVLETPAASNQRLYEDALIKSGIGHVLPDDFHQAKIGKIVNNIVFNRHANKDREELVKIIKTFEDKNIENVILACTDMQLLIPKSSKLQIHDTMKIFAQATVNEIVNE